MRVKIVVLDGYCLNPGDLTWKELEALGEVTVYDRTPPELLLGRAAGAEVLLTNKTPLGRAEMAGLGALRYVGVLATGYNVVDVGAAAERGIVVTNAPRYGTDSVAQLTIALLLELCDQVGTHNAAVRAGGWTASADWSFWKSPQVELGGKTMGCIGYGRIGAQTGRIAEAMGMRVVVHRRSGGTALEVMLEESDAVSLRCLLFAETRGIIRASKAHRMKSSAFLLANTRPRDTLRRVGAGECLAGWCGALSACALGTNRRTTDTLRQGRMGELHAGWLGAFAGCALGTNRRTTDTLRRGRMGELHAGWCGAFAACALGNSGRGPLVVEQNLADALNAATVSGADFRVHRVEPPVGGSPLFTARDCAITPHIAWATRGARGRLMDVAVENLASFAGQAPRNVVLR